MKAVSMLKILLVTYLFTGLLLVLLSLGLYRFSLTEKQVTIGIFVVYFLSGLFGGFLMGRSAGSRKFLWGILVGVLYFVILTLISVGVNHSIQSGIWRILVNLLICAGGGMLGGMLG